MARRIVKQCSSMALRGVRHCSSMSSRGVNNNIADAMKHCHELVRYDALKPYFLCSVFISFIFSGRCIGSIAVEPCVLVVLLVIVPQLQCFLAYDMHVTMNQQDTRFRIISVRHLAATIFTQCFICCGLDLLHVLTMDLCVPIVIFL